MYLENLKCSRCNHSNPPYKYLCSECKNHLRERVVNIDLWQSILKIIEEPSKVFKNIVYSEHKNFIYFLLFFISIKNLIIARFFSVPQLGINGAVSSLASSAVLSLAFTVLFFTLVTSITLFLTKRHKISVRFIDLFSLNIYAFVPYLISLVLIFPVELVVLGADIFSNNPYPYQIKPVISFTLIGFELLFIFWVLFLYFRLLRFIKTGLLFSFLFTLAFFILWMLQLLIASQFIFTI